MCVLYDVREVVAADGSTNRRNKPTVGDRPRAPSPPTLPTTPHTHDAQIHHQQRDDEDEDSDEDEDDEDDEDDDDWDKDRSVYCCVLSV